MVDTFAQPEPPNVTDALSLPIVRHLGLPTPRHERSGTVRQSFGTQSTLVLDTVTDPFLLRVIHLDDTLLCHKTLLYLIYYTFNFTFNQEIRLTGNEKCFTKF